MRIDCTSRSRLISTSSLVIASRCIHWQHARKVTVPSIMATLQVLAIIRYLAVLRGLGMTQDLAISRNRIVLRNSTVLWNLEVIRDLTVRVGSSVALVIDIGVSSLELVVVGCIDLTIRLLAMMVRLDWAFTVALFVNVTEPLTKYRNIPLSLAKAMTQTVADTVTLVMA